MYVCMCIYTYIYVCIYVIVVNITDHITNESQSIEIFAANLLTRFVPV